MRKLKTKSITGIHPVSWPSWAFVSVDDDTYTDSDWNGCDYRVNDSSCDGDGLAVDIFITGKISRFNGFTWETCARIVFPRDGSEADSYVRGKVYSTEPMA